MKKSDYAMIVLIAGMSLLISYFVVNSLPIFKDVGKPVAVKTADPISEEVQPIDKKVFNKDAINPTVEIFIGSQKSEIFSDDSTTPTNEDQ